MEVAFALAAIAALVFAVLHFTKRKEGTGTGSNGGSTRPGADQK